MQNIIESIIRLNTKIRAYQAEEDRGEASETLHVLKCRLMGERDGMRYALQMMGLSFEFTNVEQTEGTITVNPYGVRGPLFG